MPLRCPTSENRQPKAETGCWRCDTPSQVTGVVELDSRRPADLDYLGISRELRGSFDGLRQVDAGQYGVQAYDNKREIRFPSVRRPDDGLDLQ